MPEGRQSGSGRIQTGRRGMHRTTTNVGWRLPTALVTEIRSAAQHDGLHPGAWVTIVLIAEINAREKPIDSAELLRRMHQQRNKSTLPGGAYDAPTHKRGERARL